MEEESESETSESQRPSISHDVEKQEAKKGSASDEEGEDDIVGADDIVGGD